jgi:hypothetical protein
MLAGLQALLLAGALVPVQANDGDFVVWQAYNIKFTGDQTGATLLASIYVLNPTSRDYRDLEFRAGAPEGFELTLPPKDLQKASRRPQGFAEEIADGTYVMKQSFLGATQATTIFYGLRWKTPPEEFVQFPGVHIAYKAGEEQREFRTLDEENSLSRLRRFSGDITDYIKRYADVTLPLDKAEKDVEWTFTALDYRAYGRNPIGIIGIEGSPEGSGHFRLQTGYPGDFREILVRWEPRSRGRKEPVTAEFARTEMDTMIRWVGDFSLDKESLKTSELKVARYPAILLQGRWVDNKPIRLGSGPFRLYVVNDPRSDRDFFIYLGVQGRGIGPENADKPAPQKEQALIDSLLPYVEGFRP